MNGYGRTDSELLQTIEKLEEEIKSWQGVHEASCHRYKWLCSRAAEALETGPIDVRPAMGWEAYNELIAELREAGAK